MDDIRSQNRSLRTLQPELSERSNFYLFVLARLMRVSLNENKTPPTKIVINLVAHLSKFTRKMFVRDRQKTQHCLLTGRRIPRSGRVDISIAITDRYYRIVSLSRALDLTATFDRRNRSGANNRELCTLLTTNYEQSRRTVNTNEHRIWIK